MGLYGGSHPSTLYATGLITLEEMMMTCCNSMDLFYGHAWYDKEVSANKKHKSQRQLPNFLLKNQFSRL